MTSFSVNPSVKCPNRKLVPFSNHTFVSALHTLLRSWTSLILKLNSG